MGAAQAGPGGLALRHLAGLPVQLCSVLPWAAAAPGIAVGWQGLASVTLLQAARRLCPVPQSSMSSPPASLMSQM